LFDFDDFIGCYVLEIGYVDVMVWLLFVYVFVMIRISIVVVVVSSIVDWIVGVVGYYYGEMLYVF